MTEHAGETVAARSVVHCMAEWLASGSDVAPVDQMVGAWMSEAADLLDHLHAAGFEVVRTSPTTTTPQRRRPRRRLRRWLDRRAPSLPGWEDG